MNPKFFKTRSELRKWFEKNHKTKKELIVGFYKTGSGKSGIRWSESVDEALCFGWIDGIVRSIDKDSYCHRFTPRRPLSNWSNINIRKVEELTKKRLMMPEGLKAFSLRKEERSGVYSFENDKKILPNKLKKKFQADKKAWEFFKMQPPYYQKTILHWLMSAKKEETQLSRLEKLITASGKGVRLN